MFLFDVENKSVLDVLKVMHIQQHIQQHMHLRLIIAVPESYFFMSRSPSFALPTREVGIIIALNTYLVNRF